MICKIRANMSILALTTCMAIIRMDTTAISLIKGPACIRWCSSSLCSHRDPIRVRLAPQGTTRWCQVPTITDRITAWHLHTFNQGIILKCSSFSKLRWSMKISIGANSTLHRQVCLPCIFPLTMRLLQGRLKRCMRVHRDKINHQLLLIKEMGKRASIILITEDPWWCSSKRLGQEVNFLRMEGRFLSRLRIKDWWRIYPQLPSRAECIIIHQLNRVRTDRWTLSISINLTRISRK